MEDPDMNGKSAKFSSQFHDPDGEDLTRNVSDPPSPQNPNRPQPVTEMQQVIDMMCEQKQHLMNMLAEQNRVASSNWIIKANDIAHNKPC